jgi:hypothetical protein
MPDAPLVKRHFPRPLFRWGKVCVITITSNPPPSVLTLSKGVPRLETKNCEPGFFLN